MTLPQGNQAQVIINESECAIEHDGVEFQAQGAHVTMEHAFVYIMLDKLSTKIEVTDWHGHKIGQGRVTGAWKQRHARAAYFMVSVEFTLQLPAVEGIKYVGRFSPDSGNFCKARRSKK